MSNRSVAHATFVIERTYEAPPAHVFAAFSDPAAKRRWFIQGEGFEVLSYENDFRVGGWERSRFRKGATLVTNDTVYTDIVPGERIIIAYYMSIGGNPISVSLATMEMQAAGKGTRFVFTEQDAFLDGFDDSGSRERGTTDLLDALGRELTRSTGNV